MKLNLRKTVIAMALSTLSAGAAAHGYVSLSNDGIIGRAALCGASQSEGLPMNMDCSGVEWEPQSVEGHDGFPEAGPADGQIANAGMDRFFNMNEQTAERWEKRLIQSGIQEFEWTFTAPHPVATWKYYITKQEWDVNSQLTRDSFELTPFCVVEGHNEVPSKDVPTVHQCNVPEREGYQVILAVWDVADTAMSFYNVIDVEFEENGPQLPDWEAAGQIIPTMDLKAGDAVYTRVFESSGENKALSTRLDITSEQQGKAKNWAHALAEKVNQEHESIKAGVVSEGKFDPVFGTNPIYVNTDTGLQSVEIGYDVELPEPDVSVLVEGIETEYVIEEDTPVVIEPVLTAEGDAQIELTVYNHSGDSLAHWENQISDGSVQEPELTLSVSEPGHHMLVVKTRNSENKLVGQETLNFNLVEPVGDIEFDYVYPDGFGSYVAGDIVKFEGEGIYECFGDWAAHCNSDGYQPGVAVDPAYVEQQWNKLD
ncbi:N-acetylglucosamine-binding protein GbpA [Vibrio coralliilyticus]|uniref:N-acetylglucosamine-binding protein GbpA n=1 Tax=Vibrio coralliilyticus TaxID=190893 RepID=UPI001818E61C|nr:N-acetylglucosamine-binding protein GbpA [Vibrio coralliilyticus]NUW69450.1 N-acetylglucosamine-binding protein GbpA [Vibrio coralliilyticus]